MTDKKDPLYQTGFARGKAQAERMLALRERRVRLRSLVMTNAVQRSLVMTNAVQQEQLDELDLAFKQLEETVNTRGVIRLFEAQLDIVEKLVVRLEMKLATRQ